MKLKVDIEFDQLLQAIKQLPTDKIDLLKAELAKINPNKMLNSTLDFRQLLLSGPVMDDSQYKKFKATRKKLNKWRKTCEVFKTS